MTPLTGPPLPPLSPRETEVARLIAEDLADKEIATILTLSIRTIHEYLDRIGRKIGAAQAKPARRRAIARWVADRETTRPTRSPAAA